MRKKIKKTTECDKRTIICDVGTTHVRIESSNVRKKKVREPPNVRKKLSHMMLELHNMRMKPLNVRKSKGTTKCEKELSYVMLELHNMRMEPSNVKKKNNLV